MTDFYKKESPFQGISGFAGGATGLRMYSSSASSVYVDDVYSTYLYKGNSNTTKINDVANGIKLGTDQAGASTYFDGAGDQIDFADNAAWDFGSGDFTIECWIKSKQTTSGYYTALGQWNTHTSPDYGWAIRYASIDIGTGWSFFYSTNGSNYTTTMGSDISDGSWHHVAVCRSGTSLRTFTDGTLNNTTTTSDTFYNSGESFKLGGQTSSGNYFNGRLSNVRIVKGTALYTANFTPPTEALTNVTNTVFLGCQSATHSNTATVSPTDATYGGGKPLAAAVGPFTGTGSGRGGMVMTKARSFGDPWGVYSTVAGISKVISTTSSNGYDTNSAGNEMISFNNSGFSLGPNQNNAPNTNAQDIASFTFAKQEGFFDIVTYTGNGSARNISHSLGSVPGSIWIKSTSNSNSWYVYNRDLGATKYLMLNHSNSVATQTWFMNDTEPTSTQFSLGTSSNVNGNGDEYIAYIFAGGASSAATAKSIEINGVNGALNVAGSNDFFFTGDWTVEGFFYCDVHSTYQSLWGHGAYNATGGTELYFSSNGYMVYHAHGQTRINGPIIKENQWTHVAVARSGSTVTMYVDGEDVGSYTGVNNFGATDNNTFNIGCANNGSNVDFFDGKISNFRVVKGTAVYTSSFRVPTEPLTNITNTVLLCCNDSSVTGSTVTPATITAAGSPTARTDSPFDDPDGFKFGGDSENLEGIIKCEGYSGNGSSTGPEIYVGWEPQWLMVKSCDTADNWTLYDSMRGISTGGNDEQLYMTNDASYDSSDIIELTPTGFKIVSSGADINSNGDRYVYMAIRRPDGYVGKPPAAALNTFDIQLGQGNGLPDFISGFPVDFGMVRQFASTQSNYTAFRLTRTNYMATDSTSPQSTAASFVFDNNQGWDSSSNSTNISWMWKRGQGFDVVTYSGQSDAKTVLHSLNAVPEMMWVKNRTYDDANGWTVYHTGLNGGTNPEQYRIRLQSDVAEDDNNLAWNDIAPTATHFTLGTDRMVNQSSYDYIAMLFASANDTDGNPISKVGSYSGSGSTGNAQNIGFQPRFLFIKRINTTGDWMVFDSVRGFGNYTKLNSNQQQYSQTYVNVSATGFSLVSDYGDTNESGSDYIYYAHA